MANEAAEAARRSDASLTGEPQTRYDAKCKEWDKYTYLGPAPTTAALERAGSWQLVYELRPLELIPYWLGIPFRPHHPIYAVIYDHVNRGYYTAPAAKIRELGRPQLVRGAIPFVRVMELSVVFGRAVRTTARAFMAGVDAADGLFRRLEARIGSWRVA